MEMLKQSLIVPKSHKLHIDITLPEHFPTGRADVVLIFAPSSEEKPNTNWEKILELEGSLKNSPNFKGDPVAIQKAMRDEWRN